MSRHPSMTTEECAELERLWLSPLLWKDLARRFDRPESTLIRTAARIGLPSSRMQARIKAYQNSEAGGSKLGLGAEARHDDLPQQIGSAASAPLKEIPRTFDEWWTGEKARMRRAKMAAPRATAAQGPPYREERFNRVLARSLAETQQ